MLPPSQIEEKIVSVKSGFQRSILGTLEGPIRMIMSECPNPVMWEIMPDYYVYKRCYYLLKSISGFRGHP